LGDAGGNFWRAEKISPGTRVTLAPAKRDAAINFAVVGGSRGLLLAYEAASTQVPGGWTAWGGETEVAPMATLPVLRWTQSSVAYVGVAEPRLAATVKGGGP
jgi:hypothetical protein